MNADENFKAAQEKLKTLSSQPSDVMLQLYSLYKQATIGDATGKKPGLFDIVAKAKFEAWESLKGTSQDEAKNNYAKLVDELAKGS